MLCSQSEAAHYARVLLSGYPNANPTDPQYYLTNVVAVLTRHEHDIVFEACQATGIPASHPTFLPTAGEIGNWLEKRTAERAKVDKFAGLLPAPRRSPKYKKWNLFVGQEISGYEKIVEMAKKAEQDEYRYDNNYVGKDGAISKGIWVPWQWWERVRGIRSSNISGLPTKEGATDTTG